MEKIINKEVLEVSSRFEMILAMTTILSEFSKSGLNTGQEYVVNAIQSNLEYLNLVFGDMGL